MTYSPASRVNNLPNCFDRLCDICRDPIIGIMKGIEVPPRLAHDFCGGRVLTADERKILEKKKNA